MPLKSEGKNYITEKYCYLAKTITLNISVFKGRSTCLSKFIDSTFKLKRKVNLKATYGYDLTKDLPKPVKQ